MPTLADPPTTNKIIILADGTIIPTMHFAKRELLSAVIVIQNWNSPMKNFVCMKLEIVLRIRLQ